MALCLCAAEGSFGVHACLAGWSALYQSMGGGVPWQPEPDH